MYYQENDCLNWKQINEHAKLSAEELDTMIEEELKKVGKGAAEEKPIILRDDNLNDEKQAIYYQENDNLNEAQLNEYMKLSIEELDALIEKRLKELGLT